MAAMLPPNETERLQALHRSGLLDTPPEPEFDELVELAAAICEAPISTITLIDEKRQWFKAVVGLNSRESDRGIAFCSHAILQEDAFVVENALEDERFRANPLVTGDPNIRFYAGVPLTSPDGYQLGTLCVIDRQPRTLSRTQMAALRVLAHQANARLELREQRRARELALHEAEQARASLAASDARFQAFMNAGPFLSYLKDSDGRMLFYNQRMATRFGFTNNEALGKLDAEIWPPYYAEKFREHDLTVLRDDELKIIEEASPGVDGTSTFWRSFKFPFEDADGSKLVGGISVEVTEELRREAELRQYQSELEEANKRLRTLSRTDPLTGLANRRVFDERLSAEYAQSTRHHRPLAVILLDIDDFKMRNDTYGHDVGDDTLKKIAHLLADSMRESDVVVRYGGEEFVLLLPETDEIQAVQAGQRILARIREAEFGHQKVTASIGVAGLTSKIQNAKHLVTCADEALYAAKRRGKDQVIAYSTFTPLPPSKPTQT